MRTRKPTSKGNWTDPDDAPRLTEEWFKAAEIRQGGKLARAAQPETPAPGQPSKDRTPESIAGGKLSAVK